MFVDRSASRDLGRGKLGAGLHPLPADRSPSRSVLVTWEGLEAAPREKYRRLSDRRGRVRPSISTRRAFGLAAFVHRFSDACIQAGAAFGATAEWLEENRRGFSTFELIFRISGTLPLDVPYFGGTGIVHLGNTSIRFVHHLINARTGEEVARMSQYGVMLDLDARRPSRLPDDMRERAAALVVPVG